MIRGAQLVMIKFLMLVLVSLRGEWSRTQSLSFSVKDQITRLISQCQHSARATTRLRVRSRSITQMSHAARRSANRGIYAIVMYRMSEERLSKPEVAVPLVPLHCHHFSLAECRVIGGREREGGFSLRAAEGT